MSIMIAGVEQCPPPPKDPMEMEKDDWFLTCLPDRLVSWIAYDNPRNRGGTVGWAVRALPLEDPEGKPWPESLSREVQWVRLADITMMLSPKVAGGVS